MKSNASTHNNILPSRQEKAKAKKRKRRYPSYGHISGEYTFTTQSARFHVNNGGGSTNYSYPNPAYSQHNYYYKLSTRSIVRKNLHRSNHQLFQPARTSWSQGGTCTRELLCAGIHAHWRELQRASAALDADSRKKNSSQGDRNWGGKQFNGRGGGRGPCRGNYN